MKIEKSFWVSVPLVSIMPVLPPAAVVSTACIGMVLGVDELTGTRKGYIGLASGSNEKADEKFIAQHGQKITPGIFKEIIDYLEPKKK